MISAALTIIAVGIALYCLLAVAWRHYRKPAPRCEDCKFYSLKYKLTPACFNLYAQSKPDGVRSVAMGVPLSRIDSPRADNGPCGPHAKLFQPKMPDEGTDRAV